MVNKAIECATPTGSVAIAADDRMEFDYSPIKFRYEPFVFGSGAPVIPWPTYNALLDTFPDVSLFQEMPYLGGMHSVKWSLAEVNNPENYFAHLEANPIWKRFYTYIKSPEFLYSTLHMLSRHRIELGYIRPDLAEQQKSLEEKQQEAIAIRLRGHSLPLKARFEFSALPADGGQLHPHTDSPGKVVIIVLSMVRPGEWDPAYGGGTEVLRPKDSTRNFNHVNTYLDFDQTEVIESIPFVPNRALIFIKSFNSWHSCGPIAAKGSKLWRKSLTINIEKIEPTYAYG